MSKFVFGAMVGALFLSACAPTKSHAAGFEIKNDSLHDYLAYSLDSVTDAEKKLVDVKLAIARNSRKSPNQAELTKLLNEKNLLEAHLAPRKLDTRLDRAKLAELINIVSSNCKAKLENDKLVVWSTTGPTSVDELDNDGNFATGGTNWSWGDAIVVPADDIVVSHPRTKTYDSEGYGVEHRDMKRLLVSARTNRTDLNAWNSTANFQIELTGKVGTGHMIRQSHFELSGFKRLMNTAEGQKQNVSCQTRSSLGLLGAAPSRTTPEETARKSIEQELARQRGPLN